MNSITLSKELIANIFNEWAKRYSENPEGFSDILDSEGKPEEDYGICSAVYFLDIAKDLEAK